MISPNKTKKVLEMIIAIAGLKIDNINIGKDL
jgi:hypothetical protein